jgi:hypothetical protein
VRHDRHRLAALALAALALAVPASLVLWAHVAWRLRAVSPWKVGIVDKTVPDRGRREHASLAWVLDHARVASPGGGPWDAARDYVGFQPETGTGGRVTAAWLAGRDLVYIADTYGVYADDIAPGGGSSGPRSGLVFGGLDRDEVAALEAYVAGGGALVAEFNTFASPTAPAARRALEQLLGVRASGWTGRWFADLADADEVPAWMRRLYRAQHGRPLDAGGPGFVLVHEDTRVEVLRDGVDVEAAGLRVVPPSPRDRLLAGVAAVPYRYWFEIVAPAEGTEVLATFELRVSSDGAEVLRRAGVPARFPAVVRARGAPLRLYFAGDFADHRLVRGPARLAGWPSVMSALAGDEREEDTAPFFWRFYVPLMRALLERP